MPRRTTNASPGTEQLSVRAKDRASWRRWLAENHAVASSVVLIYARKDSGEPSITWHESVDEALCFGWVDSVRGRLDDDHFTVRFTRRKPGSLWSKLNLARVERLTAAGLMHPAGVAAFELGRSSGQHATAYAIRDEVSMPAELEAVLAQQPAARKFFDALSPGTRKGWMRSVSWAKQTATRAQRARDAVLLMRAGRKPGETDNQAARRGVPSRAEILGRTEKAGEAISKTPPAPRTGAARPRRRVDADRGAKG